MGVRADKGVRVGNGRAVLLPGHHAPREEFQVHLMDDAGARRHHLAVLEGGLPPAQEAVALQVALHLYAGVLRHRLLAAVGIHHHRVVNDEFHRHLGVDGVDIPAEFGHGVAHGRQIHQGRHAGEVLQEHPRGHKGDFGAGLGLGAPVHQRLQVACLHKGLVLVAQQVFQQDFEGVGQAPRPLRLRVAEDAVVLTARGNAGHRKVLVLMASPPLYTS